MISKNVGVFTSLHHLSPKLQDLEFSQSTPQKKIYIEKSSNFGLVRQKSGIKYGKSKVNFLNRINMLKERHYTSNTQTKKEVEFLKINFSQILIGNDLN